MRTMIRELNPTDFHAWNELRHLALESEPINFGSSNEDESAKRSELYEQNMSCKDRLILGAFAGDRLVGTVGFFRYHHQKTRHKGMIWGVFVHPDYQGQGLGTKLMQKMLERVLEMNGLDIILIGYTEGNEAAQKLYQKLGFKVFGREVGCLKHQGQYFNEVLMQLRAEDYERRG